MTTLSLLRQLRDRRGLLLDALADMSPGQDFDALAVEADALIAETVDAIFAGGEVEEPVRASFAREIWPAPTIEYTEEPPRGTPVPFEYIGGGIVDPRIRRDGTSIKIRWRGRPARDVMASIRATNWCAWGGDEWPRRRSPLAWDDGTPVTPVRPSAFAHIITRPAVVHARASLDVAPGMLVAVDAQGLLVEADAGRPAIGIVQQTNLAGGPDRFEMTAQVRLYGDAAIPIGRAPSPEQMPAVRARLAEVQRSAPQAPIFDADLEIDAAGNLVATEMDFAALGFNEPGVLTLDTLRALGLGPAPLDAPSDTRPPDPV